MNTRNTRLPFVLTLLLSGLVVPLLHSCAPAPLRPLTREITGAQDDSDATDGGEEGGEGESEGSESGNGNGNGEEGDGNGESGSGSETGSSDPTKNDPSTKDPVKDPKDEPNTPPEVKDPVVVNPPVNKEPKYSLLFVGGGSEKIDVYKFDKGTGVATLLKSNAAPGAAMTFMAVHTASKKLYSVNERGNEVAMYSVDPATGTLSMGKTAPTANGPTHVSVNAAGTHIFVADYGAGAVESYAVSGGSITAKTKKTPGKNAHAAYVDPAGKNVYVPCLGSGLIAHFTVNDGVLTEASPASLDVGTKGPRHMAFHPNGNFAYLMNEYEGSVQALSLTNGALKLLGDRVPSTTAPVAGNTGAEIAVHPNGKFVYSSNRGDDSIAIYSVAADGSIKFLKAIKTGGKVPRHFALDPSGRFMTVANQSTSNVTIFAVDATTGDLTAKGAPLSFGSAQYAEIFDFAE